MSKIARIYQGTNEIQKYYQGGVLQRLFFDWKHYIGNELNIEYAKECVGRNVVISGKTYQNLFDMKNLNYDYYDTLTDDGYKNINIPELSTGYRVCKSVVNNLIKANTVYTIIIDVRKNTFNKIFEINSDYNNEGYFSKNIAIQQNFIGRMIVTATSKETLPSNRQKVFRTQITPDSLGELEFKLMLLEGDYTNIDLPNSINGIESVGEREFVNAPTEYYPVTIRNYNYECKTDGIVLPNGVKNSIDTIDGKKVHTRRVGAVLLNGTQDMTLSNVNQTLTTRVRIQMNNAKVSKNNLICNWFIRTGVHGDYEYIIIQDSSEGICLFISVLNTKLSAPTVDGVKRYFNENPLWVFYEFTSPICTYLESGLYNEITIPTSNIKNEIYLENGKWYHKKNIGKVIFDGSSDENWKYYNEGGIQRFNIIMPNEAKMYDVRTPVYAVDYRFEASKNEDKIIFISGVETANKLYIYNYAYTSIEDFRAYLAENPLEVYYELAEPVISELYFTDITYKLNEPLRSLPNGVCDTIEENRLVQRVGKVVLDGSNASNFKQVNTLQVFRWEYFFDTNSFVSGICDTFPIKNVQILSNENIGIRLSGNNFKCIDIKFPDDTGFDINAFRTWLSENPVTVHYELANPIETEITPDKIPPFLLKEGLTTLKSTNNITPQIELSCLVRDDFQNMCDNEWESGDIDLNTGTIDNTNSSRIRLINYIKVKSNTKYRMDVVNSVETLNKGYIEARYYDNEKSYLDMGGSIGTISKSSIVFTTPENCYYIRIIAETTNVNFKIYLKEVF